jgi:starch synthase
VTDDSGEPLKICFVASEVAPYAKTGGLADVAGALPYYLFTQHHDVRVFMPLYGMVDRSRLQRLDAIGAIPLALGSHHYRFELYRSAAGELPVYFIDCAPLYQRQQLYTSDTDEHLRFALFCQAVIIACQHLRWAPQIFHCNDWQSALLPLYLQTLYAWDQLFSSSRTLLSIHNIGYQGVFPSWILADLGLLEHAHRLYQEDLLQGHINFLKTGLLYATRLSTVSPTYAQEICGEHYGMGLDPLLRQRRSDLSGILNGVDYSEWSPQSDRYITHRYSAEDLSSKGRNKTDLLQQLRLRDAGDAPLLGIVSRLAVQKGFDLLLAVLPEIVQQHDVRLVARLYRPQSRQQETDRTRSTS